MHTDPALLAQLQTLWQAATPIMPPPASTAAGPPAGFFAVNSNTEPPQGYVIASTEMHEFAPEKEQPVPPPADDQTAGVCLWPTEMVAADLGPFALIGRAEREYLLGRHRYPPPCGFCGGHSKHNPTCVAMSDDWHVKMPWGKHRGKPIADTDPRYLRWLLRSGKELESDLRREIERVLGVERHND